MKYRFTVLTGAGATASTEGLFVPVAPTRVADTRGTTGALAPIGPAATLNTAALAPTGLSLSTTGADLDVLGNLFSLGQNTTNRRFSILLQGTTQTSFIGSFNDQAAQAGLQDALAIKLEKEAALAATRSEYDDLIAAAIRTYIVPGIITHGNATNYITLAAGEAARVSSVQHVTQGAEETNYAEFWYIRDRWYWTAYNATVVEGPVTFVITERIV